jgi:hypothetical protein
MYAGMPELRVFYPIDERGRTMKNAGERSNGAQGRNRTTDTAIFSRMLYQLSYLGRSRDGRKWPSERAGYSGVEGCCPPAFAFGYGAAGPASLRHPGQAGIFHNLLR